MDSWLALCLCSTHTVACMADTTQGRPQPPQKNTVSCAPTHKHMCACTYMPAMRPCSAHPRKQNAGSSKELKTDNQERRCQNVHWGGVPAVAVFNLKASEQHWAVPSCASRSLRCQHKCTQNIDTPNHYNGTLIVHAYAIEPCLPSDTYIHTHTNYTRQPTWAALFRTGDESGQRYR